MNERQFRAKVLRTAAREEIIRVCREAGYERIVLGRAGDYLWGSSRASDDMVFAFPETVEPRVKGWPGDVALWAALKRSPILDMSCGNGRRGYDQAQVRWKNQTDWSTEGFLRFEPEVIELIFKSGV